MQFSTASGLRFYNEQKRILAVSYHLWVEQQRQRELWGELSRRIKAIEVAVS